MIHSSSTTVPTVKVCADVLHYQSAWVCQFSLRVGDGCVSYAIYANTIFFLEGALVALTPSDSKPVCIKNNKSKMWDQHVPRAAVQLNDMASLYALGPLMATLS